MNKNRLHRGSFKNSPEQQNLENRSKYSWMQYENATITRFPTRWSALRSILINFQIDISRYVFTTTDWDSNTIRSCYKGLCFAYLQRSARLGDNVCSWRFAPERCSFFLLCLWGYCAFRGGLFPYNSLIIKKKGWKQRKMIKKCKIITFMELHEITLMLL